MNYGKENVLYNACKIHTNRSEKGENRVCPSKLSKGELEDLYFAILDSNIQLKKTVNNQKDQIKILNTKVQRMTAQKFASGSNNNSCKSKGIINEQKELIADLKKANERLTERIKILNMRLCSAKQFLKRSPQTNSFCNTCLVSTPTFKNLSTSALYTKRSDGNLQAAATSLNLAREKTSNNQSQSVATQTDGSGPDGECRQNKCRTTVEELRQKIFNLEKELSKTHSKDVERLDKLEMEVNCLQKENVRVRAENMGNLEKLQMMEKESAGLLKKLRYSESLCDDVRSQLILEKARVSELEAQVKAADISQQIASTWSSHVTRNVVSVPSNSLSSSGILDSKEKVIITFDDSGYNDTTSQSSHKRAVNETRSQTSDEDVSQKLTVLQAQLESIKMAMKQYSNETKERIMYKSKKSDIDCGVDGHMFISLDKNSRSDQHSPSTSRIQEVVLFPIDDVTESKSASIQQIESNEDLPTVKAKTPSLIDVTQNSRKINEKNPKIQHETGIEMVNDDIKNKSIDNVNNQHFQDKGLEVSKEIPEREVKPSEIYQASTSKSRKQMERDFIDKLDKISIDEKDNICDRSTSQNANLIEESEGFNKKNDNSINFMNKDVIKDKMTVSGEKEKVSNQNSLDHTYNIDVHPKKSIKGTQKEDLVVTSRRSTDRHKRAHHTYSVASSPDNTEREISSLTDLPETDDNNLLDYLSPGEERGALLSDSLSAITDTGSLSEGELPCPGGHYKKKLTIAEVGAEDKLTECFRFSSITKMEEAVQAIGLELAHCRRLLWAPHEVAQTHTRPNYTLPLQY